MSRRSSQGLESLPEQDPNISDWPTPMIISPGSSMPLDASGLSTQARPMNLNMLPPYSPAPPVPDSVQVNLNPHGNKVAIPRITPPSAQRGRRRSARACEPCRQRKIKCDGAKPTCGQCSYHHNQCSYEDVKRVREQKEMKMLGQRVERYEQLLRSLEGEVEPFTARRIRKTLKPQNKTLASGDNGDDSDSSVGSLEDIDKVDEDLNRDEGSRAAGFFGKNSEVSWMQRLEHNVDRESALSISPVTPVYSDITGQSQTQKHSHDTSLHMMNYHLDDLTIPHLDDSDPYIVPPRAVGDEYFNTYLTLVHPSFPAVRKTTYGAQYRQFYDLPAKPPPKWLAILNMIFAIGCRYSKLANPNTGAGDDDLVYLARARKLAFHEKFLFDHPDLQQVQLELLMGLYLLCLGQINRASKFSSMALRSALCLGINLRNTDERIQNGAKEARYRLWWSIFSLEHLLTSMHGRASCVGDGSCSVPLPLPTEEANFDHPEIQQLLQSTSIRDTRLKATLFETQTQRQNPYPWITSCDPSPSSFFHHLIDLTLISQAVLNKVYSIEGIRESSSQTEYRIQSYGRSMDRWLAKLNANFQFTLPDGGPWQTNPNLEDDSLLFNRERVCLAMNYYSARITLCRPCLTQSPSSSVTSTPSSSNTPQEPSPRAKLRAQMATNCLQAACSLTSVFPNTPSLSWIARATPWWTVLHHLMQATTALLVGISYCSFTNPPQNPSIKHQSQPSSRASNTSHKSSSHQLLEADLDIAIFETKKALSWIHTMATVDPAARRAFLLCDNLVQKIAPWLGLDLSDWPSTETLVSVSGGDSRMDEMTNIQSDIGAGTGDGYFD